MRRGSHRLSSARRLGLLACLVSMGMASCRAVVGIEDRRAGASTAEPASACGGRTFPGGDACSACMASSCCAQVEACDGEATCTDAFQCMAACALADDLCRGACTKVGSDALLAAVGCRAKDCSAACSLACGGLLPVYTAFIAPPVPQSCLDCFAPATCDALASCAKEDACMEYLRCRSRCTPLDLGCTSNCDASNSDSATAVVKGGLTAFQSCASDCPLGEAMGCVGHVSPPAAQQSGSMTLTQRLMLFPANTPVEGATLDACSGAFAPCQSLAPSGPGQTDASGMASVTVHVNGGGNLGGYLYATKSDLTPTLYYPYSPPAQSLTLGDGVMVSPASIQLLAAEANPSVPFDPSLGIVIVLALDCYTIPAPHVALTVDPPSGETVYIASVASGGLTATQTDKNGIILVYNVAPGVVTLRATYDHGAGPVLYSARIVQIVSQALTLVAMAPSP